MLTHERIQALLHYLESSAFNRIIKVALIVLSLIALVIVYDYDGYRNFQSEEAMDSAQLARNLAQGRGYTTYFVRPFSVYLLQQKKAHQGVTASIGPEAACMENNHPDLANPPVYPFFLAGLMKTFKFDYHVYTDKPIWSAAGYFRRYQPEFVIDLANQTLLIGAIFLTFLIARKLFDATAAWLSALITAGSSLLWQFSVSGLSTILLLDLFLLLVLVLLKFEANAPQADSPGKDSLKWAVVLGAIIGIGTLTRYSFVWLLVPVILYLALFGGPRRVLYIFTILCAAALLVLPWIARNWHVSGTSLGVTGYSVAEGTTFFPGASLENNPSPYLTGLFRFTPYMAKLKTNLSHIFENNLFGFTQNWTLLLFYAGLLLGFRSQTAKRIRYFVMFTLVTFVFVEALGRTHLSTDVPVYNSENLLVLLAPLTFMYGVVFFLIFVDQMKFPLPELRYVAMAGLVLLCSASFVLQIWPPATNPLAFPPYHPPDVQMVANKMGPDDLIMSDIPWAVAWYGQRECVATTLTPGDDFYNFYDYVKPVNAIYLTPKTLDGKFLTEMIRSDDNTWQQFEVQVGMQSKFPPRFPLKNSKVLTSGLLLSDRPLFQAASQ